MKPARATLERARTEVFSRTLESAARNLETLSDAEWAAVAQGLADLPVAQPALSAD